jgi:hypothetical protein
MAKWEKGETGKGEIGNTMPVRYSSTGIKLRKMCPCTISA